MKMNSLVEKIKSIKESDIDWLIKEKNWIIVHGFFTCEPYRSYCAKWEEYTYRGQKILIPTYILMDLK